MTGKNMTTKNATIRLPEDIADWLTENGKSINQAIIESCQTLRRIRTVSTGEIRGVFTSLARQRLRGLQKSCRTGTPCSSSVQNFITVRPVQGNRSLPQIPRRWSWCCQKQHPPQLCRRLPAD